MRRFILSSAVLLAPFALPSPAWAAWVWPLRGEVITPYSNGDDPYASGQHRGIDIAGEIGQPVVAAADGTVRFAGSAGSSGLTVSVRTADGFDTSYLHLSSASVREGDSVGAGERIGAVGTSGTRSAERPHLHFGVRDAGSRHAYHDPLAFLPPPPAAGNAPEPPPPASGPALVVPPAVPSPEPAPTAQRGGAPVARRSTIRRTGAADERAPTTERVSAREGIAPRPATPERPRAGAPSAPRRLTRAGSGHPGKPGRRLGRVHGPARTTERASPSLGPTGPAAAQAPAARAADPSAADRAPADGPRPAPVAGRAGGPDLGLVLACIGLLGAAAMLGLSEDGRSATRRTGRRAAALLRPLLGGR